MNIEDQSETAAGISQRVGVDIFRGYRAEWLEGDLYALFTEPAFFPELKSHRPCILTGARGTGKTTLLKCLSYEGQFALAGHRPESLRTAEFFGVYHKLDTNRVRAFRGSELTEEAWRKCFAHYFNLEMCEALLRFHDWHCALVGEMAALERPSYEKIAASLAMSDDRITSRGDLLLKLERARLRFETHINNVGDNGTPGSLSMQGLPIDVTVKALLANPTLQGKRFFFLLDEYENLEDYQQTVVNTLIKHSGEGFTYKVGVKELGLKSRSTLNPLETLSSRSDYFSIDIRDSLGTRFADFAIQVCDQRLQRKFSSQEALTVRDLLPKLSLEAEASLLGADAIAAQLREELAPLLDSSLDREELESLSALEVTFLRYCAESDDLSARDIWYQRKRDPKAWRNRMNNYAYASLFSLRKGKRGFRRLYAGWDVLTQLAGSNLRCFMELVDTAIRLHVEGGESLQEPVPPEVQTRAAHYVGRKNLKELEGQSIHGANLTRLVLGLGRIFQVLAWDNEGHTPEVTQFEFVHGESEAELGRMSRGEAFGELLTGAVMQAALVRFPGSKLQDESDIRDYDYAVHPIFAALFEYSYRRKRKLRLAEGELLELIRYPARVISSVLARQRRTDTVELPEQLGLFRGFYAPRS